MSHIWCPPHCREKIPANERKYFFRTAWLGRTKWAWSSTRMTTLWSTSRKSGFTSRQMNSPVTWTLWKHSGTHIWPTKNSQGTRLGIDFQGFLRRCLRLGLVFRFCAVSQPQNRAIKHSFRGETGAQNMYTIVPWLDSVSEFFSFGLISGETLPHMFWSIVVDEWK